MLACSKDGTLKLHSLADSFKPHQSLPTTALALNSKGQVAFSHDYIGTWVDAALSVTLATP
jgi:hypothetical protein